MSVDINVLDSDVSTSETVLTDDDILSSHPVKPF